MKNRTKILLTSVLAIIFCASLIAGATFAIFTSESSVNIAISSGTVKVTAEIANVALYSPTSINQDGTIADSTNAASTNSDNSGGSFIYGTAEIKNGTISLSKMVAGDKLELDIVVTNNSDVNAKYQTTVGIDSDDGLFEGLTVTVGGNAFGGFTTKSNWKTLDAVSEATAVETMHVVIELPTTAGDSYQTKSTSLYVTVTAVQGNTVTTDPDGSSTELYSVGDFTAFANAVNAGANYQGQTVKLAADIDLSGVSVASIGTETNNFAGTFDGNGYTVSNLTISSADSDNIGLFGYTNGATIQNVTLENSSLAGSENVGAIVGSATSTTVKDCVVTNTAVSGAANVGGAVGSLQSGSVSATVSGGSVSAYNKTENDYTALNLATEYVGGIVGEYVAGDIAGSASGVAISGTNASVTGGIYGVAPDSASSTATSTNCTVSYALSDITYSTSNMITNISVYTADGMEILNTLIGGAGTSGYLRTSVEGQAANMYIKADIDMENHEWISHSYGWFTFDGENHTISNLTVTGTTNARGQVGLFSYGGGATVKNLVINNMTASGDQVGAIFGNDQQGGTISNVTLKGTINLTYTNGGIEDWPSVGAFFGVNGNTAENLTIDGTVNIDMSTMSTSIGYVNAGSAYHYTEGYGTLISGEQATITENGKVIVKFADGTTTTYTSSGSSSN